MGNKCASRGEGWSSPATGPKTWTGTIAMFDSRPAVRRMVASLSPPRRVGVGAGGRHGGERVVTTLRPRRWLALRLPVLAILITVVACAQAGAPNGRAQTAGPFDPRGLAPPAEELPPGFTADPARTSFEERPDGTARYDVAYARPAPDDDSTSGPTEIRFSVARTHSGRDSADLLAATRQSLTAAGWTERPVPPLGDEAAGLSLSTPSPGVVRAAHVYMFRFSRHVLGSMVSGPAPSTNFDQALDLAIRESARLDAALAAQPLDDPAPAPATAVAAPRAPASNAPAPAPATAAAAAPPGPSISSPTIIVDARADDAPDVGGGLRLGGFSGLYALDKSGTLFATVTDRGPNGDTYVPGKKQPVFPLPNFSPSIVKLRVDSGHLQVVETIPLRLLDGYTDPVTSSRNVTGLPSYDGGEVGYAPNGKDRLPIDPNGLDTEGLAIDPRDGSYWLCEEYGPSVLHVAADGTILARLVPRGLDLPAPGENVRGLLPEVLLKRKPNRGFEGVGIAPDGSRVFALMQSPVSNPDKKTGEASRHLRLVVLDTSESNEPKLAAMYVYQTEAYTSVGAEEQDDVKIGDLAAVSATRLLVAERDSDEDGKHKKVYLIDLAGATDILNREDFGGKTLEQASEADLRRLGVEYVRKSLALDLAKLGYRPEKFEGLALVDPFTIAAVNDNDFEIDSIDARGKIAKSGTASRLVVVRFPDP